MLPKDEEGKVDVERGVYETNIKPKWETFKYYQEGQFCIGVAKVGSKEDGTTTGMRFWVFE